MMTPYDVAPRCDTPIQPMDEHRAWPRLNAFNVRLSKIILFGLLPICFMAWLVAGKAL
ncbi:hypothetical protein [Sphingomonas sp.]|uniref:hypothetical protein n=1 Tax=Sphingomonas sp. TaxID=28214 RepID=UPI003B3BD743